LQKNRAICRDSSTNVEVPASQKGKRRIEKGKGRREKVEDRAQEDAGCSILDARKWLNGKWLLNIH
jgi:hypothetical protein